MSDQFAQDEFEQLHCDVCGHGFGRDDLVEFQGSVMCAECKSATVARMQSGHAASATGRGELPPWERREELGPAAAFLQTLKAVVLTPRSFFERMDKTFRRKDCLGYAMLVTAVSFGGIWLVQTAVASLIGLAGVASGASLDPLAGLIGMQGVGGCFMVIFAPIAALVGVYLLSVSIHGFLALTRNANAPFHQTVRGVCYALSPNVLQGIPVLGMLAGIYTLVCLVLMVTQVHRASGGVAALSVLWLWLAGCCISVLLVAVFGIGVLTMFGSPH